MGLQVACLDPKSVCGGLLNSTIQGGLRRHSSSSQLNSTPKASKDGLIPGVQYKEHEDIIQSLHKVIILINCSHYSNKYNDLS